MKLSRRHALIAGAAGLAAGTLHAAEPAQSTERPVRRTDYLLSEEEAWYVVRHTNNAVLGTADASGTPYAVPITPLEMDGKIYFHGTKDPNSRKFVNLTQNPKVSIVWVGTDPLKEDEFTVKYVSAMVAGRARRIEDPKEMQAVFEKYTRRFAGSQPLAKQHETIKGSIGAVALWEVTVEKISGKAKTKTPFFDDMKK